MKIQIDPSDALYNRVYSVVTLNNKSFVVPRWIQVPLGTTIDDISIVPQMKKTSDDVKQTTHKVKGSTGKIYDVTINAPNGNSCTCTGFEFRKSCRHINEILNAIAQS